MKNVDVIILCEDKAQESFVREFLKQRGYNKRMIRTTPLAGSAGGSAEAYVRTSFPGQLQAIRERSKSLLITVIDADKMVVARRIRSLDEECGKAAVGSRTPADRVVVAVPRRNVESWFVYLTGGNANEETDEWKRKKDDLAKPAAKALHKMCYEDQKLRGPAPPSLEAACHEWKNANANAK